MITSKVETIHYGEYLEKREIVWWENGGDGIDVILSPGLHFYHFTTFISIQVMPD